MNYVALEAQMSQSNPPHKQPFPKVPKPREPTEDLPAKPTDVVTLIPNIISEEDKQQAKYYIEEQLENNPHIQIGSFVIGLLERVHTIPNEMAVEDVALRERSIALISELLIQLDAYTTESGKFNSDAFIEDVTIAIDDTQIYANPLIILLVDRINQVRKQSRSNRYIESQLVTVQRVVLLGLSKQLTI